MNKNVSAVFASQVYNNHMDASGLVKAFVLQWSMMMQKDLT